MEVLRKKRKRKLKQAPETSTGMSGAKEERELKLTEKYFMPADLNVGEPSEDVASASLALGKNDSKRKKKKGDTGESLTSNFNEAAVDLEVAVTKDDKRRKKRKRDNPSEHLDSSIEPITNQKKKKSEKSVDNESKLGKERRQDLTKDLQALSPEGDSELTDQTLKGLAYAYSQFAEPSAWKFNKARQNWLIRNFWSEASIPERYLPLVTKYLAGVKGGVRESLNKICHSFVNPTVEKISEKAPDVKTEAEIPTLNSEIQKRRARILLRALQEGSLNPELL